jgi:hypothetical protein
MTRGSALNCRKLLRIGYLPPRTAGAHWSSGLPVLATLRGYAQQRVTVSVRLSVDYQGAESKDSHSC